MKILHELNQLDCGGVERVIRNIIKFDNVNEHSVLTYKDGPYRKPLEAVGAEIIIGGDKEGDETAMEADVIHIHTGGGVSHIAMQLGRNFPIVETIHSPVRSAMPDNVIRQRIGVTDVVSAMNKNCQTIYNGLDFDELEPTIGYPEMLSSIEIPKHLLAGDNYVPIIGRLGRLGRDKGCEEWLLTCYELQQKGLQFIPLIVGGEASNAKGYMGKLKLIAASLPVYGCVFTGNQEDISDYLQIMDVFLYPSVTEGFGLSFIEALYNECIVVSYDTPVNKELLGGYSILTKQEEGIMGLVKGVEKALDQNMRDALQGIQVGYVESEFEASRMSNQYQEIYERCNGHSDK